MHDILLVGLLKIIIITFHLLVSSLVTAQRMNFLSNFGPTPSIMQGPPKEHLVEQASIVPFSLASFSLIAYFIYEISIPLIYIYIYIYI